MLFKKFQDIYLSVSYFFFVLQRRFPFIIYLSIKILGDWRAQHLLNYYDRKSRPKSRTPAEDHKETGTVEFLWVRSTEMDLQASPLHDRPWDNVQSQTLVNWPTLMTLFLYCTSLTPHFLSVLTLCKLSVIYTYLHDFLNTYTV